MIAINRVNRNVRNQRSVYLYIYNFFVGVGDSESGGFWVQPRLVYLNERYVHSAIMQPPQNKTKEKKNENNI